MKSTYEVWDINDLIPYENNPRHNDRAIEYVAESIREFGFRSPIVVDEQGVIIAGHTRLKAAQSLNLNEVPVLIAHGLTEEQVKALRLVDNKTGEFADWDFGALTAELDEITINMEDFGFSERLPDIDIDGIFQEHHSELNEKNRYLKWGDRKIEITDQEIAKMDEAYDEWEGLATDPSFVDWLLEGNEPDQ